MAELASLSRAPDMPTSLATVRPIASRLGSSEASSRCRSARRLGRGGIRIDFISASTGSSAALGRARADAVLMARKELMLHGNMCKARHYKPAVCKLHESIDFV